MHSARMVVFAGVFACNEFVKWFCAVLTFFCRVRGSGVVFLESGNTSFEIQKPTYGIK